ncbi:metal-sensing transcriptional repressor [Coleofasciculus sp. F4-SAH-05]|uniref:metal-sensing transcriptional repressor n=1 Tax=Coleofasciculus sp. F4-SAH-05 TaxID=3069525 RepID=UPI0032FE0109
MINETYTRSASDPDALNQSFHTSHGEHEHDHAGSTHTHVHDEESLRRIINRLSRIEGHIRGIKTMVQESRPCPDVLVQVAAVRGALNRVARIILDEHLSECIGRAAEEGNMEAEIEQLKTALDRFLP